MSTGTGMEKLDVARRLSLKESVDVENSLATAVSGCVEARGSSR